MPRSVAITEENCWEISGLSPEPEPVATVPYGTANGHLPPFDVAGFLANKGVPMKEVRPHEGGTIFVLGECVFDSSHRGKDAAIIQRANGQLGYKCWHNSCSQNGWKQVREKLDPGCYDRKPDRQPQAGKVPGTKDESNAHHLWEQIEAPYDYDDFRAAFPSNRPVVIDQLQRHGEVMNLIAATKVGKSWTTYEIAWRLVTGGKLWDLYRCNPCNVLLIDNELHSETLSSRLALVRKALGIPDGKLEHRLRVQTFRGRLLDFEQARRYLNKHFQKGDFQYLIFDAYYRLLPKGVDENSNSDGAQIANIVDAIARDFDTSVLLIHHATKGNQSGKSVTDVGSGASAMARAADTHLVLRPHEEDGVVVGDAALRSFAPVDSFCMKWGFPLWKMVNDLDASKLKPTQPKVTLNQIAERVFNCLRDNGPATKTKIREQTKINNTNVGNAVELLLERKHIEPFAVKTSNGTYPGFRVIGATPDNPGQTPDSP